MARLRTPVLLATLALATGVGAFGLDPPTAHAAAAPPCAATSADAPGAPASSPSAGHPCWTDVTPYPFGGDGNAVTPGENLCGVTGGFGPTWSGDFALGGQFPNPPCYLQVTSMAFRAWNRGLAATSYPAGQGPGSNAFGVWLYNGNNWYPDPAFPGAGTCPGTTVMWAGKLDYWLIGAPLGATSAGGQTVCRFDGVNLVWEAFTLPAATMARLPLTMTGRPVGGITTGSCYAWNDCTFFGTDGIAVHWDGQNLSDASVGLAQSPWLEGDFTAAIARTDASGRPFGLAVTRSTTTVTDSAGSQDLPARPDGSSPPQLFSSQGGAYQPLDYSPPGTPQPGDPYPSDLVAIDADAAGSVWVAGDPNPADKAPDQPAPLTALSESGSPVSCPLYDASTFTRSNAVPTSGYQWRVLSVFPGGPGVLAGASYQGPDGAEPALVQAACGQAPVVTRFRIPSPLVADQAAATTPRIPADTGPLNPAPAATAVAANASNDAWAATSFGQLTYQVSGGQNVNVAVRPHLYRYTDGGTPDAPPGDDSEPRPTEFFSDPPVYIPAPPIIEYVAPTQHTVTKPGATKHVKLPPAIYSIHDKLVRARGGGYTLYIIFRVRRRVRIGVQALAGRRVVASSGIHQFAAHRTGRLALALSRRRWPNHLRFIVPK